MTDAATASSITIVPANEASCEDLRAAFGSRGESSNCHCQRFKTRATDWDSKAAVPAQVRAAMLRAKRVVMRIDF